MEDEDGPVSPFWLKKNDRRRLDRSSSFFQNPTLFVILLLIFALLFMFIIVPSIQNVSSKIIIKPEKVKKKWDSLNVVLVLIAIVCAFLSRIFSNDDDDDTASTDEFHRDVAVSSSSPLNQNHGFEYGHLGRRNSLTGERRSHSYPDLHLKYKLEGTDGDGYGADGDYFDYRRRRTRAVNGDVFSVRDIPVDTIRNRSNENIHAPSRSTPSPPAVKVKRRTKRIVEQVPTPSIPPPPTPMPPPNETNVTVARDEIVERPAKSYLKVKPAQVLSLPPPPLPFSPLPPPPIKKGKTKSTIPSPPSPPPISPHQGKKNVKSDKKRESVTLTNQQKEKKKQRQKSVENYDNIFPSSSQQKPPPPPPPPPQTSVFKKLFPSKKNKNKKVNLSAPPLTPPPSTTKTLTTLTQSTANPFSTNNPNKFYILDDSSGSDSPLRLPPPPPPPPFKIPSWKFPVKGDFVSLKSYGSSDSKSPDRDDAESSSIKESPPPMFHSSPDINTKADNYISDIKARLELERINSIKEKKQGNGLNKLGPDKKQGPDPGPNQT